MKFTSILCAALSLFAIPGMADADTSVLRLKSGDVKLTLLSPDGIRPLANVEIGLQDARESGGLIQAVTDRNGSCAVTLERGTFGLSIAGRMVALLETSPDAETTHLRLVTPRQPLRIGGAEGTNTTAAVTNIVEAAAGATNAAPAQAAANEEAGRRGLFAWVGENGLKTALIIGGAVATGVIMENENDGPSRAETPAPAPPPARPRRSRPSTPDIDPPVSN